MTRQIIVLLIIFTSFWSCDHNIIDDSKIAREICDEIDAETGKFYYSVEKVAKTGEHKHFLEFEIFGCKSLDKKRTNKFAIASYAATQLYKRLNPKTITDNFGINIIFDSIDNPLNSKEFFFENTELLKVWTVFDNISKYLKNIDKGDFIKANSFIDTNYFALNLRNLDSSVKSSMKGHMIRVSSMYGHFDFENKSGKTIKCFNVVSTLTNQDSTKNEIDFLIPIMETDNKIINLRSRQ